MPTARPSLCLLLLTAFWAAIYLPALGTRELQGEEARRVLPGRTMMQTGEWIVPRSGGEVYNRKPPLVNWMSAAAMSITGRMDEWTVRVPSTLMMLALALSVFLFMRLNLGNEAAFLAALITLTNIGFVEKGRLIEIEALYMSLFGIAMVAWLGLQWQKRELAAWVVSGLVLGLGFLAKGPLHVFYFYAIAISVLASTGRARELLGWKHGVGLACFVSVWAPWAMMNSARNPNKDSGKVWAEQITHRLGFVEFDFTDYLLQIPQSLVNFLPWALLLPLVWRLHREGEDLPSKWMRGIQRGLLWAFLIVAVLPSSRPRFMLPLTVVAAIVVAAGLMRLGSAELKRVSKGWFGVAMALSILAALAIAVSPWTQASGPSWVLWSAGLLVTAAVLRWLWKQERSQPLTFGLSVAAALALGVTALAFQTVSKNPWKDELRQFAANVEARAGNTAPILLYKVGERMWPFYLGQRCYETLLLRESPRGVKFQWLIVGAGVWNNPDERALLEKHYGKATSEMPLREPRGDTAYVLVGTAPKR